MGKYKFNPLVRYKFDQVKGNEDGGGTGTGGGNGGGSVLEGCTCDDILLFLTDIRDQIKEIKLSQNIEYFLYWEDLRFNYDNPIQPYWEDSAVNYENPDQPDWITE